MENSNCGIAASADLTARAGKIRYDIEMNSKFHFFAPRFSLAGEPGHDFANRARNFKFLLTDRKFGKTAIGARVIRCGLLPRAPLSMAAQAHSNP